MEPEFREKKMILRAAALVLSSVFLLCAPEAQGQARHFYNVDTERKVEGVVLDIVLEPRYQGSAPFLVVILEDSRTRQKFNVEISPSWFFEKDVHKGEKIEVTGSLAGQQGETKNLIARQVRCQGETIVLRDPRGFPRWRGAGMMQRGRRRGNSR